MMNIQQPAITVDHLYKSYGPTVAVSDVSFAIQAGEIFGIVGPNGAGKTTTVECLMGLRQPDRGDLRVLGMHPIQHERELRQRIGIQLQQASLPDDMKVWEALDLFASFYKNSANWKQLLETWGLADKRNARFARLSGGQKQRLFIALSLVNNPEIVFLDELTTGLDPQARRNAWEMISKLRDHGKTVVLVTHYMDEAEKLCDRVAIIDLGKLIALDTPQNLIRGLKTEIRVCFTQSDHQDLSWLQNVTGVDKVQQDGQEFTVSGSGALLARVASGLADHGIIPADLRSQQASLEDVFLTLTGRQIRE